MPALHWKHFSLWIISMNDRTGALQHLNIVACILKGFFSHAFCLSLKAKIRSILSIGTERVMHAFISLLFLLTSAPAGCCLHVFIGKEVKLRFRAMSLVFQHFFNSGCRLF